jgi:hypothetical protein
MQENATRQKRKVNAGAWKEVRGAVGCLLADPRFFHQKTEKGAHFTRVVDVSRRKRKVEKERRFLRDEQLNRDGGEVVQKASFFLSWKTNKFLLSVVSCLTLREKKALLAVSG